MKTIEKTDITLELAQVSPLDNHATMPEEFAGMYQAGYEAGAASGKEAGYRQGFGEGYAAAHLGKKNGAALDFDARELRVPGPGTAAAIEGKPAPKYGPRRMLLGMPCPNCRVYLLSEETRCPCCKQARVAA